MPQEPAGSEQPFSFVRDDAERTLAITFTNAMTTASWAEAVALQIEQQLWSYGVLFDLRTATDFPFMAGLDSMIVTGGELVDERGPRGPVAVVVPSWMYDQSHERFDQGTANAAYRVKMFTDVDTARAWLVAALADTPQ